VPRLPWFDVASGSLSPYRDSPDLARTLVQSFQRSPPAVQEDNGLGMQQVFAQLMSGASDQHRMLGAVINDLHELAEGLARRLQQEEQVYYFLVFLWYREADSAWYIYLM